jgi:hypothetical protein
VRASVGLILSGGQLWEKLTECLQLRIDLADRLLRLGNRRGQLLELLCRPFCLRNDGFQSLSLFLNLRQRCLKLGQQRLGIGAVSQGFLE